MSEQVAVPLGSRSYDIHVGLGGLARTGPLLKPFTQGRVYIVTDRNVAALHLKTLETSLTEVGVTSHAIILEPGEPTKSFGELERLCSALLGKGIERASLLVALGGGVIGDLTGFAAGILKRGIDFVQIPTTLLAMVDSSVGGKTGINTLQGKNLVGLFNQPKIVIADIGLLETLPPRELRAGYAEIVKYAVLGDVEFFTWLEKNGESLLAGDAESRIHAVAYSCRMKAAIVSRDERESGERALLNLGHTFGHALEAATGYSGRLLHGEAVAIGMVMALRLSIQLDLAPQSDLERLVAHLHSAGLPTGLSVIPGTPPLPDELLAHMAHDKKSSAGRLAFVLLRRIGDAFVSRDVPLAAVRGVLSA